MPENKTLIKPLIIDWKPVEDRIAAFISNCCKLSLQNEKNKGTIKIHMTIVEEAKNKLDNWRIKLTLIKVLIFNEINMVKYRYWNHLETLCWLKIKKLGLIIFRFFI